MKRTKYELALEFINSQKGKLLQSSDICAAVCMEKGYAASLLDSVYATGGGQIKQCGHSIVYLFDYDVTTAHINPFMDKKRDAARERKRS